MAAAQNLSPEERMEMIEGMVTRLETRLTERGGGPEDWVRLIRALSVLGRDDDARRIYDLSQQELKGSEAGFVREQALAMGVIEG
jgi:cytochrome c-type biogenesis protein CcmH